MVTAVKRPAGEPGEKWLRDLAPDNATAPAPDPTGQVISPGFSCAQQSGR